MKWLSFITQFKIEFLLLFTGCRKVLEKMPGQSYKYSFTINSACNYTQHLQTTIFIKFLVKCFFCNITWTGQTSLPNCAYFPSYSVKCVSCFMLTHFMTRWHLNIRKVKVASKLYSKIIFVAGTDLYKPVMNKNVTTRK